MNFAELTRVAVLLGAAMLLTGCSKPVEKMGEPTTVSGTVKLNGKPFSGAALHFYSLRTGLDVHTTPDNNGAFKFDDQVPEDTYRVYLFTPDIARQNQIPEKFRSETSSDFSVTLQPGTNTLDIDLQ